jgi:two-component system chemotaxis response regulator CheY
VVGEAENGDEAVKVFAEQKPELVMLDMIMPGKTGLETLQEIRVLDPKAKVVMVTAVQQEALTQELLAKGALAILHKPFMYGDLEAVLNTI